jgi:hypothetical protein
MDLPRQAPQKLDALEKLSKEQTDKFNFGPTWGEYDTANQVFSLQKWYQFA